MTKTKATYHPTKLRPIVQLVARMIQKDPTLLEDIDDPREPLQRLRSQMKMVIPALADKTRCPNCGASMAEYNYNLSVLDVLLVQTMARDVRDRLRKGVPFTEANKVHVPTLRASYTVICRKTYSSKLGLIAKYKGEDGKHVPGVWVVTARGWAALRGEAVPRSVLIFRNQILERDERKATFSEIVSTYKHAPKDRADYTDETRSYDQNEWVDVAGMHQGSIL